MSTTTPGGRFVRSAFILCCVALSAYAVGFKIGRDASQGSFLEILRLQDEKAATSEQVTLANVWLGYCQSRNVLERLQDQDAKRWPYTDDKMMAVWRNIGDERREKERRP